MSAPEASLQALLSLEHEAVWWYGVAAGRPGLGTRGLRSLQSHRARRDELLDALTTRSIDAPGPQVSYAGPSSSIEDVMQHSQGLENRIAAANLVLIGEFASDDKLRAPTVAAITRAALAAHTWGAPIDAFPGLD